MSIAKSKLNTPAAGSVTVVINGERQTATASTLDALLREAGYGDARIATALNGDFVPERQRAATPIADGDRIEIVSPRQGG